MLILGIDPGSRRTGWGLVDQDGASLSMRGMGVIRPGDDRPLEQRLAEIHAAITDILRSYGPECVAIETVFHGVNTRALVTLGQARGVAMAAAGVAAPGGRPRELVELSPAEIKKAVTGNGQASKTQVAHMVGVLLGPEARTRIAEAAARSAALDSTDALAVAIAALHRRAVPVRLAE